MSAIVRLVRWMEAPCSARPLACLRVGTSAVLLVQALALASWLLEFHGHSGLIQGGLRTALESGTPLPIATTVARLAPRVGIAHDLVLRGIFAMYVASLGLLLLGYRTRAGAVGACLGHALVLGSGLDTSYGLDHFAQIALFYLMVTPCADAASIDAGSLSADRPSGGAGLGLRVLRVHLSIAYVAAGLEKAAGKQWRDGDAIWRALMLPEYQQLDFGWMAGVPSIAAIAAWATLATEIGYPVWMLLPRLRPVGLTVVVGLHLGIAVFMGLHLFAAMMIVLTVSAFAVPADVDPRPRSSEPPAA